MTQAEQRALALQWANAKDALDTAKKAETELRAQLLAACFPDGLAFGTQRADLGEGHKLKVEVSKEGKITDATACALALGLMREDGELGGELADRVVKMKPALVVGEFQKLPERYFALFKDAARVDQGSPSATLERPDVLRLARAH